MDLKTPPLNALKAFDAIVRTENISQAAKLLHVTQSAISQQQKLLENYLGIRLFNRAGKQLKLTPCGEIYARNINAMFDNLRMATRQLLHNNHREDIITVNTSNWFATHWLMPHLDQFETQYPDIEFRVSTPIKEIDFYCDDIDAGIYYSLTPQWPQLKSMELMRLNLAVFCSPQYLSDHPNDLITDGILLMNKTQDNIVKQCWDTWLSETNHPKLEMLNTQEYPTSRLALRAAVNGKGILISDTQLIGSLVEENMLIQAIPETVILPGAVYAVFHPELIQKKKFTVLKQWLFEKALPKL